jgi:myo-inositol 2-dehydrogenase / D-chiro-inositol 1-dehydrogenase
MKTKHPNHRRKFIRDSAVIAGAILSSPLSAARAAHVRGDATLRVAVIGCGGRGAGAASQVLHASPEVQLVAVADVFRDRIDRTISHLIQEHGKERVQVPEAHRFTGLDSYIPAIALADLVLLTSPPGFRPMHFEEAVRQGKHVFMEKPVATDAPGVRKILELNRIATEKNLKVVVGHHLRFQKSVVDSVELLRKGVIGDLVAMRSYFNSEGVWVRPRQAGESEMEYQVRNWYYFTWLSGDHIVEQHVHNLDFMNWVKGQLPVRAQGMGGREVRKGPEHGHIFDHHFVEFEYPDGSFLSSQCRHIKGCWEQWADGVQGTQGRYFGDPGMKRYRFTDPQGREMNSYFGKDDPSAHQVEQTVLVDKILRNEPVNQTEEGAMSTMTAILGRMATYSGQMVTWEEAFNSRESLVPGKLDWDTLPPILPGPDGEYPVAVPGKYRVS